MRLATSTNILYQRPGNRTVPLEETLYLAEKAGFKTFDMCFYDWVLPGSPFLSDSWEIWCEKIQRMAEKLQVGFGQCHVHFYNFCDVSMSEDRRNYEHKMLLRSIDFCSRLGSGVCVTHPATVEGSIQYRERSLKSNQIFFERLLEETERLGVCLAVENMCDYSISPRRKFASEPEDLVALVDSFQSDRIGICWDFEHGVIMQQNQVQVLDYIGKRLLATHVSDTHSKTDADLMHVMPLFGDIEWKPIMQALRNIDYQGDFSFEAHNYANRLPDEVLETALKLSYQIGSYLLSI